MEFAKCGNVKWVPLLRYCSQKDNAQDYIEAVKVKQVNDFSLRLSIRIHFWLSHGCFLAYQNSPQSQV
jgi:hypothetical protein